MTTKVAEGTPATTTAAGTDKGASDRAGPDKAGEKPVERAPEPIDDAPEPAQSREGQPEPAEAPKQERPSLPPVVKDDKRDVIVRRAREKRDADRVKAAENLAADKAALGLSTTSPAVIRPPTEARREAPQVANEPVPAPAAGIEPAPALDQNAQPAQDFTLTVNGQRMKKSRDEVIALAQIAVAGDSRLEETKRLLKEAQALHAQAPEHQPADPGPSARPDPTTSHRATEHQPAPPRESKPASDPAKLKAIVERIQLGDADEGVAAIGELMDIVKGEAGKPADANAVAAMVQQHMANTETKREIDTAVAAFQAAYPEIAADELLADAGRTAIRNELIRDLKSCGVSDDDIAPLRGDARALAYAQRQLRTAGHPVRTYQQLLSDTGKVLSQRFGIGTKPAPQPASVTPTPAPRPVPANDPKIAARVDAKRTMTPQPRHAGARVAAQPTAPRPKTAREIIVDQRRARGFPVA